MTTGGAVAADVARGLADLPALGLVVWAEARGETPDGQVAVAQVVTNRRASGRWGQTIAQVVTARSQFSGLWPWGGAANHERVLALARALADGAAVTHEGWRQCVWVARGVLEGDVERDVTRGSTHYLTTALLRSGLAPAWTQTWQPRAVIGAHTFGVAA